MRVLVIILLALLATPVLGKDWGHYDNTRFGYSIDTPPGFGGPGESDNGDGQILDRPDKAQVLYLWGGAVVPSTAI